MLHLQAGGMGILYTDHLNDYVCSRFREKMGNARTRTCKPEMQWLIWREGTGETYQTGKLPEPDHCLVKQLQGWELGYPAKFQQHCHLRLANRALQDLG